MKRFAEYISERNPEDEELRKDIPGQLSLDQEYKRAEDAKREEEARRQKEQEEAAEDREIDRSMYRRSRMR
jgi:hypothetical protein